MNNQHAILITGGTGQVGFELHRRLMAYGKITAPTRHELDLANADAVEKWLTSHRPSLIINAAAYTAVDRAETERQAATRLNAELADYCKRQDALLIHYSSDYVYPGNGQTPWEETSQTAPPLSHYGQTKLQGDLAIQHADIYHLIFRTSWVYSARGHNFIDRKSVV